MIICLRHVRLHAGAMRDYTGRAHDSVSYTHDASSHADGDKRGHDAWWIEYAGCVWAFLGKTKHFWLCLGFAVGAQWTLTIVRSGEATSYLNTVPFKIRVDQENDRTARNALRVEQPIMVEYSAVFSGKGFTHAGVVQPSRLRKPCGEMPTICLNWVEKEYGFG